MKLRKAEVSNFGSYNHLEFDFENLGLALIHGATGSGKSTLQDITTWILFGVTAKDGNADEIRSWTNPDEPTKGVLDLEVNGIEITVFRNRGKAAQNDLYWIASEGERFYRGKDLTETQKLLEQRLGVSKDLYMAGAYYNEFSPTGAFFTAKAKDRRELFEKLADLSLAKTISEKSSNAKKETKKLLQDKTTDLAVDIGHFKSLESSLKDSITRRDHWYSNKERSIATLLEKLQSFEDEKSEKIKYLQAMIHKFEDDKKQHIEDLKEKIEKVYNQIRNNTDEYCPTCGLPDADFIEDKGDLSSLQLKLKYVTEKQNPWALQLGQAKAYNNPYNEQIEAENLKVNPFESQIDAINCDIMEIKSDIKDHEYQIDNLNKRVLGLSQLADLSADLRGLLLNRAIKDIETQTNQYLESYFDADLRVLFNLDNADDLDIIITKNGHQAVYKQLSKGQRGLLKLCFSVSVMTAAANTAGVHFNCVFLDEALDGMDSDLKVKAFNLFSELEKTHESILVVEHNSELKQLFNKSFLVTMENDLSGIRET